MQCADRDLIRRLSDERQHPETGRVFQREKWDPDVKKELLMKSRNRENEEEEEQETEDLEEEVIQPAVGFQKCLTSKLLEIFTLPTTVIVVIPFHTLQLIHIKYKNKINITEI